MSIQAIQSFSTIDWTSLSKTSSTDSSTAAAASTTASTAGAAKTGGKPPAGGPPPSGGGAPAAKTSSSSSSSDDSSSGKIYDKRDLNKDGTVSAEEMLEYAVQQQQKADSDSTDQSSGQSSKANVSLEA